MSNTNINFKTHVRQNIHFYNTVYYNLFLSSLTFIVCLLVWNRWSDTCCWCRSFSLTSLYSLTASSAAFLAFKSTLFCCCKDTIRSRNKITLLFDFWAVIFFHFSLCLKIVKWKGRENSLNYGGKMKWEEWLCFLGWQF